PKLLDRLTVDYYGTQVSLRDLASFSVPEPRLLVVQPHDRGAMAAMEKAILSSDLGLTPSNDGNVIRLSFPLLTEERRKELIKLAHDRAEEGRVSVRNVRRHAKETLERLERDHAISKDDLHRSEKELQRLTDQFIGEVEELLGHKEKELREVGWGLRDRTAGTASTTSSRNSTISSPLAPRAIASGDGRVRRRKESDPRRARTRPRHPPEPRTSFHRDGSPTSRGSAWPLLGSPSPALQLQRSAPA